MALKLIG
jgi:hypothetical protein